jgi:hypothetical protein
MPLGTHCDFVKSGATQSVAWFFQDIRPEIALANLSVAFFTCNDR